jgi:hypothetical protein
MNYKKKHSKRAGDDQNPFRDCLCAADDEGVLSPEEVNNLTDEARDNIMQAIEKLQGDLQKILQQVPLWQREAKQEIKDLNKEMANFAIGGLINELIEKYQPHEKIIEHIEQIQDQIIENADDFLPNDGQDASNLLEALTQQRDPGQQRDGPLQGQRGDRQPRP